MSKTIFTTQEGPANALALNKDNTQVVIAGRNVFKVFAIEEDKFVETCNLRVGKNLNLNFSCNDIAWNTNDDHILATAATNGAVVVWNLNRPSRSKQEYVFSDHKRTVNKVCFNPVESNWLISGSQDGTMKTFDLRTKEATKTFYSNTESVRDVQFSPHSHLVFASVSENGNVQTWDVRRHDKCFLQFTAHSGPVFACDWHPESTSWLATASRDKTIKVWDLSGKPTLEYTINTIASVGRVKWRPQNKYHIASVALVVDSSVNVWDIRRPYVPFAAWTHHRDVATGIVWKGDPNLCLSTSRDCTLYQNAFKDATYPAALANPQGLAMNSGGRISFANKVSNVVRPSKIQGILRRGGIVNDEFWQASSVLQLFSPDNKETEWFLTCANQYILSGKTLSEICDHNASVSRQLGRMTVSLLWTTLKALFTSRPVDYGHIIPSREVKTDTKKKKEVLVNGNGVKEDEERSKRLEDNVGDFSFGDAEMDPLSLDFEINGLDGLIAHEWTLLPEAFPLRHEIQDQSPPPEQFPNGDSPDPNDSEVVIEDDGNALLNISAFCGCKTSIWDCGETLAQALRSHAENGDIQTPVCVLLALGDKRTPLLAHIDVLEQENWFMCYLDLLTRHQLWIHSTEVIRLCWLPNVTEINQQSTTIYTGCYQCNKSLVGQPGWLCSKCGSTSTCSICHQVVRGLYVWCQGCLHGGHLSHMKEWISKNNYCPTGCGHACEFF